MKLKKITTLTLVLVINGLAGLNAQEAVTVSGGNASGNNGFVSYSIGQVACIASDGTNGSVSEGVQQPFEIFSSKGLPAAKAINLVLTVYPNPATDYVLLETGDYNLKNLSYQLFDITGKLLANKQIESSETRIAMTTLPAAVYLLKVSINNSELKTFQIIKSQ